MPIDTESSLSASPSLEDLGRQWKQTGTVTRTLLRLRSMAALLLITLIAVYLVSDEPGDSEIEARSILVAYQGFVEKVVFAPDGRTLATMDKNGVIRLWNVASAREINTWGLDQERSHDFAFAPDGQTLATAEVESITFRSVAAGSEGEPRKIWPLGAIQSLRYSPDGTSLLTANREGTVQLWDIALRTVLADFETTASGALELGFTPDGICCATIDQNFRIWTWKGNIRSVPPVVRNYPRSMDFALAFTSDGSQFFAGNQGGAVQTWETATGTAGWRIDVEGWITAMALSADDRLLACGRNDGTVVVLDLKSTTPTNRIAWHAHALGIATLAFSPDGRLLASGSNDSTVKIWDVSASLAEISASPRSTLTLPVRRALCSR